MMTSNRVEADAGKRGGATRQGYWRRGAIGYLMSVKNEEWVTAKRKYRLTDVQIQMARELGMNPRKFGSLANHKQEKWKAPLSEFIEDLYHKRFRKEKPDIIQKIT